MSAGPLSTYHDHLSLTLLAYRTRSREAERYRTGGASIKRGAGAGLGPQENVDVDDVDVDDVDVDDVDVDVAVSDSLISSTATLTSTS
jgi:hypothetical protein